MATVRSAWKLSLLLSVVLSPSISSLTAQTGGAPTDKPVGPVHISDGVMAGQRLTKVDPSWPKGTPAPEGNGLIVLHVIIRKDGTVRTVDVVSGDPPYCTIGMEAVKQWTYKPYLLNGEPMEVDTTVTMYAPGHEGSDRAPGGGDPPAPVRRARISGGVLAGNLIEGGHLTYPKEAKEAGVGGTVVMKAIIGKDGTVQNLTVISGPDMLQSAALDGVKQWVYKPYLLNGVPTEVETTITVNFNLGPPPQQNESKPF